MAIRKITGTTSGLVTKAELQNGPLNVIKATVQQSGLLATLASQMDIIKAGVLQPLLVTAALVDQGMERFQYLLDFVLVGEQDRAALLLRKSLTDVLTLVDVSEILIIYIERQLFDQLGQTDRQTLQTVLGKNDAFGLIDPVNFNINKQLADQFQMAELAALFIDLPRTDLVAIPNDTIVVSAGYRRGLSSTNLLLSDQRAIFDVGLGKADVFGLVDPLNFSIVKQLADQFQTPDLTGVADGSTYAFVLSRADITEALESRIISASYLRGLSSTNLLLADQRTTFDIGLGRLESLAVSEFMDMLRGLAKFEEAPISERRFMLIGHPANDATYGTGDDSGLFIGLSLQHRDPATVALADVTDLFAGKFLQHATTAVSQTALSLAKQLSDIATVLSLAGVFDGSTFDFQQYRADQFSVADLLVNLIQTQRLVNDLVDPADTLLTRSISKQLLDGADVVEQRAMRVAKALTDDQITEEVAARFFGKPLTHDTQLVDAGHALFIFKDILHDPEMLEQTEFIVLKTNTDDAVIDNEFTRIFDARRTFEHGSILTDAAIVAQLKFLADAPLISQEFSRRWIIGRVLEDSTATLDSIFKFEQRLPAHSLVVAERIQNFYITKTLADLTQMQDLAGVGDGSLYRMSLDKFELQEITDYRAQRVRFRRRARDGFSHSVSVSDFMGIVIPILITGIEEGVTVLDSGDNLLFNIEFSLKDTPTAEELFRRQVEFYRYPHHNDIGIAGEGFNSTTPALDDNANSPGPAKFFQTAIPSPTKADTTSTQVVVGGVQVLENLLQYSESIGGTSWDQGNGGVTISLEDTTFTNPVGGVTGVSRLEPGVPNRYIGQLLDANRIIVGQAYTFSVYLYTAPYTLAISVDDGSGGFTQSLTVPNISAWTRYSITFTATTTSVKVYIGNASAWDANEAVFAWGAQVNSGTVAGTYVKTTDAVFASLTPNIRNQTGETANWFLTIDAKASAQYTTTSKTTDFVIPNAVFKARNSVLHNSSVGTIINPKDRDQVGTVDFQTYLYSARRVTTDGITMGRGITTGDKVSGFDFLSYSLDIFNNSTTGTTSTAAISPASATNILSGLVGSLDDGHVPYVLPWNISWYGRSSNTIYISTNSYIFFDTYEGSGIASGYSDIWVAAEQYGQGVLSINGFAPTGTSDYIVSSLGVLVTGTAPNRIVSVVYKGFPYNTVPVTDDDYNTWQVQFFEARPWQHSIRMQNTFAIVTPANDTSAAVYSSSAAVNIWTNGYDLQGNAIRDSSDAPIMQIGTSSSFTFATSSYAVTTGVTLIGETTPFFVGARKFETVSAGTTGNSTSFSNLLLWSTDIGNSSWQLSSNVTVDRGVTFFANPEGGTGGITRITSQAVADGASSAAITFVGQTLSATAVIANTIYNFSFWARTSSGTANFGIGADPGGGVAAHNVISSITVTNSWQRFNVAFDPSNTSPHVLMGTPAGATASVFDSTEPPVFVWGAQVTAGSSVSTVHTPTAENPAIAPTRYNNDPVELTSFNVTKLMKRGATSTTSGVTDLFSASTDPVYAGQRLFQGNQGSRRSGDQFERLAVNYAKPLVDDAAPAYNNVVRDFASNLNWEGTYRNRINNDTPEILRYTRWRDEDLTQIWNYTTSYTAAFQAIETANQTPVQADGICGAYDDGVYGPFELSGVFYIGGVPYSHVLVTPDAEVIFGSSSAALVNTYVNQEAKFNPNLGDLVTTSTIILMNALGNTSTTSITLYDSADPSSTAVPLMRFSSTTTLSGFSGWNANIIRVHAASFAEWSANNGNYQGGFETSNLVGYLVEVILLRHPQTGAQIIQLYTDYHNLASAMTLDSWGSGQIAGSANIVASKQYVTTLGSKDGWFIYTAVNGKAQNRIGWTTGSSRGYSITDVHQVVFDTSQASVLFSDVEPLLINQLPMLPVARVSNYYFNTFSNSYDTRILDNVILLDPVTEGSYGVLYWDNALALATPNINVANSQTNAVPGQRYIASVWINPRDYQPNRVRYSTFSPYTDVIFEVSVHGTVVRDGAEYLSQSSVGTVFFGLTAVTTGSVTYAGLEVVSSVGVMISNTTIKTYPLWYNAQGRLEGLETLGAQDFDNSYSNPEDNGYGGVWHRVSFVYTVQSSITSVYAGRGGGTVHDARSITWSGETSTNLYLRVGRRVRHGGQILNVSGPANPFYAATSSDGLYAAPQLELAPRTQTLPARYINPADYQTIHPAISVSITTSRTGTYERIQQFGKVSTDNVGVHSSGFGDLPDNFLSSSLIWASSNVLQYRTLAEAASSSITDIDYYLSPATTGLRFIQTDVVTSNSFTWTGRYGLRDQLESGENFVLQYRAADSSSWVTSLTLWTGGTNWSTSIVTGLLAFTATLVTAATTSLVWRFAVSGADQTGDQVLIRNPVLTINSSSQLISISSTVGIADSMSATGTEQFSNDYSTGIATRTALTDREASLLNKGLSDIPLLGRGTTSETYPERRSDDNLDTAKFLITKRALQGANSTFTGAFTSVASISSTAERIFIGDPSLAPRRSGASLENISYFVDKAAKYGRPATTVTIQTIQGNNGAASSVTTTQTTSSADLVGTLSAYRDAVTYFRYPWYPTFDGEPSAFDNLVLPGDDSAYPAKLLIKRARLDDGSMGTSRAVMLSQDALFFDKRAKRGVAGTVRLNTIDPNPDIEFAVSSVLVSRTAVDDDEVGTLDQFSLTYLLFRFFEDYPQAGSGVDQARGNDLERIRFLMTKLIGGDGSEILDLVGVGDGNIFNFALARRDNFSFGSGSSANQTFPARAKSGALENTAVRFDLTAKQGRSTVNTVSSTTVLADDWDRLFVGQQYGNIRLSGDPLERLLYRAEMARSDGATASEQDFLQLNKFVYEDDMTTGRVIVGTALRGYNSSNLVTNSEQVAPISGSWIVTNGSITATTSDTTFTNPVGGVTGVTKLRPTTTNRYLGQEITSNLVVGQIYNWSLWVRTTGSSIGAGLYADPNGGAISFDAGDTFTVTGTWNRFSTNFVATTTVGVRVFIGNASIWDTNEELFIWGAQVTASTSPLAYFATTGTASAASPVTDRYSGDAAENTAFLFNKSARRGADGLVEINTIDYNPDADNAYSSVLVSRSAADVDDVGTVDYWVINWNAALTLAESLLVGRYDDPGYRLYGDNAETVKFFIGHGRIDDVTMLNPQPQFVASIRKFDTSTVTDVGAFSPYPARFLIKAAKQGSSTVTTVSSVSVLADDRDRLFVGQQYGTTRLSGDPLEQLLYRAEKLADAVTPAFVIAGNPQDFAGGRQFSSNSSSETIRFFVGQLDRDSVQPGYTARSGTSTNLVVRSESIGDSTWNVRTASVDTVLEDVTYTNPVGGITGVSKLRPTAINQYLGQEITSNIVVNVPHVFSVYLRSTGSTISTNLSADTDGGAVSFTTTTAISVTGTWTRFSQIFTPTTSTGIRVFIGNAIVWDTNEEVFAWGAQVNYGTSATAYVPAPGLLPANSGGVERYSSDPAENIAFAVGLLAKRSVAGTLEVNTLDRDPDADFAYSSVLISQSAADLDATGIIDVFSLQAGATRSPADLITVGSGVDPARGNDLERVRFLITKLIGDSVPMLDLTDIFDGLNYRSTILKRDTVAAADTGAGRILKFVSVLAKQGNSTVNTLSSTTVLASDQDRVFVGQQTWQEFAAGARRSGDRQERLFYRLNKLADQDSSQLVAAGSGEDRRSANLEQVRFTFINKRANLFGGGTSAAILGRGAISATFPERRSGNSLDNPAFTVNLTALRGTTGNLTLNTIDDSLDGGFAQSSVTIAQGTRSIDALGMLDHFNLFYAVGRFFEHAVILGSGEDRRSADLERIRFLITKLIGDSTPMTDLTDVFDGLNYSSTIFKTETTTATDAGRFSPYPARFFSKDAKAGAGATRTVSSVTALATGTDRLFVGQQFGNIRLSGDLLERVAFNIALLAEQSSSQTVQAGSAEDRRDADLERVQFTINKRAKLFGGGTSAVVMADNSTFSPYPARFFSKDAKKGVSNLQTFKTIEAIPGVGDQSSTQVLITAATRDTVGIIDYFNSVLLDTGRNFFDTILVGSGIDQRQTAAENIKFFITKLIGDGSEILDLTDVFDGLNYRSTILKSDTVAAGTNLLGVMDNANANLLQYSESIGGTSWDLSSGSVTISLEDTTFTNPVGGVTGVSNIRPTGNNVRLGQALNSSHVVVGQAHVWSVYLRTTGTTLSIDISADINGGGINFGANQSISVTGTWTRFSLGFTPITSVGVRVFIGNATGWDTNERIFAWGAQVNAGATAATYVKTTDTVFIVPLYPSRYSGDTLENTAFLVGKQADALSPPTVTMGTTSTGIRRSGDTLERVSFLVGLPKTDQATVGSDLDQRQNLLENIKFNVGLRETHAAPVLDGSEFSPYPARFFGKIAKQGRSTVNTVSSTTVLADDRDRLFVGQQAFQGFAAGARRSGDRNERISFNVFKDVAENREILQNFQTVWTARLNNGVGQMFEELTLLPDPAVLYTESAKYEMLEATESIFVSRFLQILPVEQSGDLDPYGNINNMTSNGKLRMINYADIDYFEGDYVGELRSFT